MATVEEIKACERLIICSHNLVNEWRSRQEKKCYAGPHVSFDLSDIGFEYQKEWASYRSLGQLRTFMDRFADAMNYGFAQLDDLTWPKAVAVLERMTTQVEAAG